MADAGRKHSKTGILVAALILVILGAALYFAFADFDLGHKLELMTYKRISTPEELISIKDAPNGKYILAKDIDLAGIDWVPFTFNGILEGNGHTVSNLKITQTGMSERRTYDGNMKEYDTVFAGMFDVIEDAEVRNLNLSGVNIDIASDAPCFIGSVAGYMGNSKILNCSVEGTLKLMAHDRMFGVGGVVGYGFGRIDSVNADITLICIDTDRDTKDEQFMGGVCAAGYPDVVCCNIKIDGYDSDHGYVHNGGLVGMFQFYPKGTEHDAEIGGNHVSGKITFFEDNEDRRAYCDAYIGERMERIEYWWSNSDDFTSNEVFEYDVDLLP